MAKRTLNSQILRAMTAVAFVAFAAMYFGSLIYDAIVYRLNPNAPYEQNWSISDYIALGVIIAIGQSTAAYAGWRLARRVVSPLETVAAAIRAIAAGDFSARAAGGKAFGEVESLIADFNRMAKRLESAEADLRYSNTAIAHELRTPLTILRGRLQGLSDGVFAPSPELYRTLVGHIDDLTRLVDDLRTLSLCNAGRLELRLDKLDLALEAESVIQSIEPAFAEAGITVERDLGHVQIQGDSQRIRQALFAVLDNVRRYAPGATVRIETRSNKSHGLIRCADTGPGLADGAYDRAFERFWRADDSRARVSGGTGLGLPIVRAIAEAHGGDAIIRPGEAGGSVVEISLPTYRGDKSKRGEAASVGRA